MVMLLFQGAAVAAVVLLGCIITSNVDASETTTTQKDKKKVICDTKELYDDHPVLCHMLNRLRDDEEGLAEDINKWAKGHGLLVGSDWDFTKFSTMTKKSTKNSGDGVDDEQLPVVFAHGMGDSCFNDGFQGIVKETSKLLDGAYTVCIPTGDTQSEDTTNGYFLNMDASVDVFASKIRKDPKLVDGFHAIGLSQGNNVIRGYIAKHNDPPVDTFISINGVNAGIGAVPNCFPTTEEENEGYDEENNHDETVGRSICDLVNEQASKRAYTEFAQERSFQANYWRDPRPEEKDAYEKFSQLARWNNEGKPYNQTLKDNYAKTKKFVWILATEDSMVWPHEGEHWGAPSAKDPYKVILPMNQTDWYINDLFGLRTAQEAGKNYFEQFVGDHLRFTMEDYGRWVHTYLTPSKMDVQQKTTGTSAKTSIA